VLTRAAGGSQEGEQFEALHEKERVREWVGAGRKDTVSATSPAHQYRAPPTATQMPHAYLTLAQCFPDL